jgi:hypothetical protein
VIVLADDTIASLSIQTTLLDRPSATHLVPANRSRRIITTNCLPTLANGVMFPTATQNDTDHR